MDDRLVPRTSSVRGQRNRRRPERTQAAPTHHAGRILTVRPNANLGRSRGPPPPRRRRDSRAEAPGGSRAGQGARQGGTFAVRTPAPFSGRTRWAFGNAMKARELSAGPHGRAFVLVFDCGDEVIEELTEWCRAEAIRAARFTAVGVFSDATVAWFDWDRREYRDIPVLEQVEVLSLNGDVADDEGDPAVHAHVVLGTSNGNARGGHLRAGHVRPTLELILDEPPAHLRKRHDATSGLALIDPQETSS